jgi:multiple sugar transport system substrate-binding protein
MKGQKEAMTAKEQTLSTSFTMENRISRRRFLAMSAAVAGSAWFISACAPATSTAPPAEAPSAPPAQPPAEQVSLRAVMYAPEPLMNFNDQILPEFMAQHPNIQVSLEPSPDAFYEKIFAMVAAGTAPDVFDGGGWWMPQLAQRGQLLDLQPLVNRDFSAEMVADFSPGLWNQLWTPDRKIQFGIPQFQACVALYYNKTLFDEVGVAYPDETWDHDKYLEETMKFIRKDESGKMVRWGGYGQVRDWGRMEIHLQGFGGSFMDPADNTHCTLDTPEAQAAIEWCRARIWDDNVWPQTDQMESYWSPPWIPGQVATLEDGSWFLRYFAEGIGDRFDWDVAPMPRGPVRRITYGNDDAWLIYQGTKFPEAAWELVKFLVSPEYLRGYMAAEAKQPPRLSMLPEWYTILRQTWPYLEQVNLEAFGAPVIAGELIYFPVFKDHARATEILDPVMEAVIVNGTAGAEALAEAARQLTETLRAG